MKKQKKIEDIVLLDDHTEDQSEVGNNKAETGQEKNQKDTDKKNHLGKNEKNIGVSQKDKSPSPKFGIIALVIATIAVLISINSLIKLKEWNVDLKSIQVKMDERFTLEQQSLDLLERTVKNLDKRQKILRKHWSNYQSAVLPVLQQKQPVDLLWQLQKAYTWLKQAELDLRWSGDLNGALLLLKASADVIEQSKIPQLQPIHDLIKEDISGLVAVKLVNESEVLQQIKTISDDIVLLPVPASKSVQTSQTEASTSESTAKETASGWREMLHKGVEAIKNVVIIKPTNGIEKPMPSEQSRQVLNENISLALQQIQWALLKKDNTLFHWSINEASELIQKNPTLIDLTNPQTELCLNNLKQLAEQNLTPTLPDIEPASNQLGAYVNTLTNAAGTSENNAPVLAEKVA